MNKYTLIFPIMLFFVACSSPKQKENLEEAETAEKPATYPTTGSVKGCMTKLIK